MTDRTRPLATRGDRFGTPAAAIVPLGDSQRVASQPETLGASTALVQVQGLSVSYGAIAALRGVSITAAAGEAVAILGANGAGKTTLLRALSGQLAAKSGAVTLGGQPILGLRPAKIVQAGIAHVPEGRQIFGRLSVRDNLRLGAFLPSKGKLLAEDEERIYSLFPRLSERAEQIAGTMSGGEQQMLAIGRALLSRPKVLLLDEPSMGLAPIIVDQIFETLTRIIREDQLTLVIVEQNARAALDLAERGYLLESGEITAEGNSATLSDSAIRAAYLGSTDPP